MVRYNQKTTKNELWHELEAVGNHVTVYSKACLTLAWLRCYHARRKPLLRNQNLKLDFSLLLIHEQRKDLLEMYFRACVHQMHFFLRWQHLFSIQLLWRSGHWQCSVYSAQLFSLLRSGCFQVKIVKLLEHRRASIKIKRGGTSSIHAVWLFFSRLYEFPCWMLLAGCDIFRSF